MKSSLSVLGLLCTAQAHLVQRQAGGFGLESLISGAASAFLKNEKPAKIIEGSSLMKREGVKNIKIYHGPFKLLPAAEAAKVTGGLKSDKNSNSFFLGLEGFPQDSYILKTNSTLQFEDGSAATINEGIYNHHVQLFDLGGSQQSPFQCGEVNGKATRGGMRMPGGYFGGSAADGAPSIFTTLDGSFNSGYHLGKKSPVVMSAELVNYGNTAKSVYHVTEVDYVAGKPPGIMGVNVGILSVNQCDQFPNPFLRPPEGKKTFEMKSKNIFFTQDGYMLSRRGHMHDGGTGMVLKVNDKLACDSKAQYGKGQTMKNEAGNDVEALMGMLECNDPFPVKKGDKLSIEAYFDLNKHPARAHAHGGGEAEGMALLGFVFAANATA